MNEIELDHIKQLYDKNIEELGTQSSAVGWKSHEEHMLRLQMLSRVVKNPDRAFTINDYGCGYGSQYHYMIENGMKVEQYFGYDISELMLDRARMNLPKAGSQLFNSSQVSTLADYSIVGGTFNYKADLDDRIWLEFIQNKITELFDFSKIGLSFNLLTSFVDWRADGLYYGDPGYFLNWCKEKLQAKVTLHHDYDLYEWTIIVHKD